MIVSAATIQNFDAERSKQVIGGLSRLFAQLNDVPPPGFIQSLLLREDKGEALFLTLWEDRSALGDFMATDKGQELARGFGEIVGREAELKDYFVTWQTESFETLRRCR